MSVCNCRGGPTCCMRGMYYPGYYDFRAYDRTESWKCPECGVWVAWWVHEHRCKKELTLGSKTSTAEEDSC